MTRTLIGATLLVLAVGLAAPVCSLAAAAQVSDETVRRDVHRILIRHSAVRWKNIHVTSTRGVVHLVGAVDSVDDRLRVEREARAVAGVVAVKSHLTVGDGGH